VVVSANGELVLPEKVELAPDASPSLLAQHLQQALLRRLRETIGSDRYNSYGQLGDWRAGLVPGIEPRLVDSRMLDLRGRLARPESPAALVLNSFLPWLRQAENLPLADIVGFRELHFDARCPTGVRGTPPHIELMASGPLGAAGVTARAFDYLGGRQGKLSPAYASLALPPALASWGSLVRAVSGRSERFHHVDVPSLAKLAIGLGRIFIGRPIRLVYLFLEPIGAEGMAPFSGHRAELARLVELTRDSGVRLVPASFHEFWDIWAAGDRPAKLREIVAELGRRYAVAMPL
jgi:hypothetical protein